MKIGTHIILCVLTAWLQMHPYLKGNLRETCILLTSVVGSSHLLTLFARAVRYTRVYLACI